MSGEGKVLYSLGPVWPVSIFWEMGSLDQKCEACGGTTVPERWNTVVSASMVDETKCITFCENCAHFLLEVLLRRYMKGVKGREPQVLGPDHLRKEEKEEGEGKGKVPIPPSLPSWDATGEGE